MMWLAALACYAMIGVVIATVGRIPRDPLPVWVSVVIGALWPVAIALGVPAMLWDFWRAGRRREPK